MTGLKRFEDWLDKGNEILNLRKEGDDRLWVSKDEALVKVRELLAEESRLAVERNQWLTKERFRQMKEQMDAFSNNCPWPAEQAEGDEGLTAPKAPSKSRHALTYCGDCVAYKKPTCALFPKQTGESEGAHSERFGCNYYRPAPKEAPSRTGELVKRLRKLEKSSPQAPSIYYYIDGINEILRDFEGGRHD